VARRRPLCWLRDTGRVTSGDPTTPDLVELTRRGIDAVNRRDLDAAMSLYSPDVVWESLDGFGVFEGATAVRGFLEDWLRSYEAFDTQAEEALDLGGGITFVVVRQSGRLLGAAGRVEQRFAWAIAWERGFAVRGIAGMDLDQARAAAERLARERADG
jgi:ketosteroid isomerase-like protein